MRSALVFLAWCSCVLPADAGEAPKKRTGVSAASPKEDLGITVFHFDPADTQILSARYTSLTAPVRDAKIRLARLIATNGFAALEVSEWVWDHPLDLVHNSTSLGIALESATVADAFIPKPLVTGSVAADLSEDRGTLIVEYLHKGKLCKKRADYGTFLILP
jgi:hypothetical protein